MEKFTNKPEWLEGKPDIGEFVRELHRRVASRDTSLQVGHTSIEDGDLVVRNGNIVVSETDDSVVMKILHGTIPEIRFFPLGDTDTHRVALYAFDAGVAPNLDQAAILIIEMTDTTPDGGKLLLFRTGAVLSHQPDGSGGDETFLWLNAYGGQMSLYRGRWPNTSMADNNTGLYMGTFTASAGFSTWTHSYLSAFATLIVPVCTVTYSGATLQWNIDNYSASSFTMRFSTTTNSKVINLWNFRL